PGATAGPESPPFSTDARESSTSPPFTFSPVVLWHLKHDSTSTGRIFFSKNSTCSGGKTADSTAPHPVPDAQRERTRRRAGRNRFIKSAGGGRGKALYKSSQRAYRQARENL